MAGGSGMGRFVGYGYTMRDLDDMAAKVVWRWGFRWPGTDKRELRELAWEGIAESLCQAGTAPSVADLLEAGRLTIEKEVQAQVHDHGRRRDATHNGSQYQRYWSWHAANAPSPETSVVERVAVAQILAALTGTQRGAVAAFAATGDYALAAQSLAIATATFSVLMRETRDHFAAMWHENEAAPRRRHLRAPCLEADDGGEVERYVAALGIPDDAESRTYALVRACLAEHCENNAAATLAWLRAHGWKTDARDPLGAVGNALRTLTVWGEAERVRRGVYRAINVQS